MLTYRLVGRIVLNLDEVIIGNTPVILEVKKQIAQFAPFPSSVLITGETGTGKELVARALHALSERGGEFKAINVSAVPSTLLESELFGHTKGAFTDAVRDHDGYIMQAKEGTLFLDEIGEMPYEMQAKLLRVLQERTVMKLGGSKEIPVDFRLVTATNKELKELIGQRRFREDLFYRIKVLDIAMPALRNRMDDIPLLVNHFIRKYGNGMDPAKTKPQYHHTEAIGDYHWPGNIRQLENLVQRACILGWDTALTQIAELNFEPPETKGEIPAAEISYPFEDTLGLTRGRHVLLEPTTKWDYTNHVAEDSGLGGVLKQVENQAAIYAWRKSGSIEQAARILGIETTTLKNMINTRGIIRGEKDVEDSIHVKAIGLQIEISCSYFDKGYTLPNIRCTVEEFLVRKASESSRNTNRAAELLNVSKTTFTNRLLRYGLNQKS